MPPVSSFTRTNPHRRSLLTSKRKSTRFACTGRKGSVLDLTSVGSYTSLTKIGRHHHPNLQERRAPPPAPEKPRSPSPAPEKPGRGRSKSPRATPAACCVHAAAASDAGHAFQGNSASRVKKKVLFVSRPEIKSIPVDGRGGKLVNRPRRYSTCYPNRENCRKPDSRDARYAVEAARLLEQAVKAMLQGIPSPCDYECPSNDREDFNVTCQHCEEVSKTACAGALAGIQFLADTGSEEDLISKHDHQAFFSDIQVQNASKPVSLITANGPRARRQVH